MTPAHTTPAGTTPAHTTPAAAPATDPLHLPEHASSWADLADLLSDDWLSLRDGRGRFLIRLPDGLGLVEQAGLLRARERRGLHRRGFRLQRADGLRVWVWAPPDELPLDARDLAAALRRGQERGEAVRRQALRAVREVLRAEVQEVSVLLLPPEQDEAWDDDSWDDDGWDDDGWGDRVLGRSAAPCPR